MTSHKTHEIARGCFSFGFFRDGPIPSIPASEREIRTPLVVNAFPILLQGSLHLRAD